MLRAGLSIALLFSSSSAYAATFPFEDARYLRAGESEGGAIEAKSSASAKPLLVFLHGINEAGPLHRGLGAGSFDLRSVVEGLMESGAIGELAVAGPSQTKEAWTGSRLWAGFDLDAFVDAAELALDRGSIDRSKVILAGHSGAGCNANGGLLASKGTITPLATLVLDTCMDADFGKRMGEETRISPVHVFYQTALWPREIAAFRVAFDEARKDGVGTVERLDVGGANPHDEIVPIALRKMLPQLLPAQKS